MAFMMKGRRNMRTNLKLMTLISVATLAIVFSFEKPSAAYQPFISSRQNTYKWNVAAGPVRWSVLPGAPESVRESMLIVTKTWSDATNGAVVFEEGPGGISVEWDPTGAKLPDALYLAYAYFHANNADQIYSATITINALTYTWQRGGASGVGPVVNGKREANLDSVLMHELGHALGLDHSCKNPSAIVGAISATDLPTMNSVILPGAETLHTDDDAGIKALYATGTPAPPPPGTAIVASPLKGKAPLNVSFSTNDGSIALWDFGTGKKRDIDSGANATHKFTAPGTYTVSATANGVTTTITIEVERKGKRAPKQRK